jgi:hypothetical protein
MLLRLKILHYEVFNQHHAVNCNICPVKGITGDSFDNSDSCFTMNVREIKNIIVRIFSFCN